MSHMHGELAAAAERKARDRGDHRLARVRGRVPVGREVAHERVDVGLVRHLLDVGAGGERLLRAGDQDAADAVVGIEGGDRLRQLGISARVERIERLRPVEPDDADAALGFDDDGFVGDGTALRLDVPDLPSGGPATAQCRGGVCNVRSAAYARPRKSRLPISTPAWRRMS